MAAANNYSKYENRGHLDISYKFTPSKRDKEIFSQYTGIHRLNLENNKLKKIPDFIKNLINIEWLELKENKIKTIPDFIGDLRKLELLNLHDNSVRRIPDFIGRMPNLAELILSYNGLTKLPESIGRKYSKMHCLTLNHNHLSTLPDSIKKLKQLEILYLNNNQFKSIPASILKLPKLNRLFLQGNPLKIDEYVKLIPMLEKNKGLRVTVSLTDILKKYINNVPKSKKKKYNTPLTIREEYQNDVKKGLLYVFTIEDVETLKTIASQYQQNRLNAVQNALNKLPDDTIRTIINMNGNMPQIPLNKHENKTSRSQENKTSRSQKSPRRSKRLRDKSKASSSKYGGKNNKTKKGKMKHNKTRKIN